MPEAPSQQQPVAAQSHPTAAIIAATLLHNKLSLQEGLEAFDQGPQADVAAGVQDQDGRLSLDDMVSSSHDYHLDLNDEQIKQFHDGLRDESGFIQLHAWRTALEEPEGLDDVLASRGIKARPTLAEMLNMIAASLTFNNLSIEDGFDAFDNDGDGQISPNDLQAAVRQLQLDMNEEDVRR
eukprot:2925359-Rhodomonas_salina.1